MATMGFFNDCKTFSNANPPILPKNAGKTVYYNGKEIKYCSECPYHLKSMVYYDPEIDQDVQDIFCKAQAKNPMVHWALHWNEIATCTSRNEGDDFVPETCPLLNQN